MTLSNDSAMVNTGDSESQLEGKKPIQADPAASRTPAITFPEGGLAAWLTVAGG